MGSTYPSRRYVTRTWLVATTDSSRRIRAGHIRGNTAKPARNRSRGDKPLCCYSSPVDVPARVNGARRQGSRKTGAVPGGQGAANTAHETGREGMEPRLCRYGRIPAHSSLSATSRAGEIVHIPPGKSGRGLQPIPGTTTAEDAEAGDRHHDVVTLLHSLHGRLVQKGTRDGPPHGGSPAHRVPPPREGSQPTRMAGVRYPVPNGTGSIE